MKKRILIIAVFLVVSISLTAASRFSPKNFFSQALNQDKTYFVSLPDGYNESDASKKYPVILFLHGATVNAQDIVNKFDSIIGNPLAKILIPNFFKVIFVIPDGSAAPYLGSFYTNSELYGNYETYIATDLYSEINEKYNTYANRAKWSIMGHSMGGYGSTKIALKYPSQYIGVASLSGPLDITYYNDLLPMVLAENGNAAPYNFAYEGSVTKLMYTMAGAFSPNISSNPQVDFPISSDGTINQSIISRWETNNPINYIRTWKGKPSMGVFLYCGEKDEYKLLSQNQRFSDTLSQYGIKYTFKIDPQGDHVYSLLTSFPLGLNFLYGVMDTAKIISTGTSSICMKENSIFPNPAKERLYLSSGSDYIVNVTIISSTGSVTQRYAGRDITNGVDISNLKAGFYMLSLNYKDGKQQNLRFIKIE
ncbi:MAG TPA: alpha/beta hydrolase-fold protein [Prolixibacteraceae bacterium]|nr:alpha/beta hydrolase-fold protein [Prolixibacteraceae bacterium]